MYIILPSRLNEYPSGNMKETILSFTPKPSNSSVNFGNTASLLVVPKAIAKGPVMRLNNSVILPLRKIYPTAIKITHKVLIPIKNEPKNLK
ncbi:hypothetical protein D3C72_848360 [compost metagenome]